MAQIPFVKLGALPEVAKELSSRAPYRMEGRDLVDNTGKQVAYLHRETGASKLSPHAFDILCKFINETLATAQEQPTEQVLSPNVTNLLINGKLIGTINNHNAALGLWEAFSENGHYLSTGKTKTEAIELVVAAYKYSKE